VLSKLIETLASTCVEYRHLKPDFVTGHGAELWGISETEMNFKTQEEKLTKFRTGKSNVLVGTSVVEEGVDIPKCNLVVMFDFPQNFRAFVQSRGRGRAKGAKYVLLVLRSELGKRRQEQEVQLLQNKLMVNFNK
jgi:endoribonuclease Dicer